MSDQPPATGAETTRVALRPQQTFEGVQILRGVAASMVVFHHMCWAINAYRPNTSAIAGFRSLAEIGASGVDVFFCISGLVIAYASRSLPAGWASARTFAWRRILRVVPPYWTFTLALLLLWATRIGFKDLIVTPGLVVASLLLIPYPKRTMTGDLNYHPVLDVGWTLTFEMYFYAICMFVIMLAGGRRIWPAAIALLSIVAVIVLAMSGPASVVSSVLASPMLIEFAAGVVLAQFVAGRTSVPVGTTLVLIGAVALLGTMFVANPMASRVLWWGIPGVLLVAGAMLLPITIASRSMRFLGFLGTASYTIYLAHPLFQLPLGTLLKRGYFAHVSSDVVLILATIVGIIGSASSYFIVEGPLLRALKPRSRTAAMARETVGV